MAAEVDQGFIPRKLKGAGEYQKFYLEGIELLQELSGKTWTDYNEHDPGVTILESISYALTELSNKTQLPIENLLVESKGSELESGDNGFFTPSEIMTTNPVTINDFRKLMIDRITNVKNVWIHGQGGQNMLDSENLKGLYRVFVEMYRYNADPLARQKEEARIKGEVFDLFHSHRNLCEDIYDVNIYRPFLLKIDLTLTLDKEVSGEDAYARIYFDINDHLSHDVNFNSLWELQEKGLATHTIFNGPKLENGFILDSELKQRLATIESADLIKIISQVEGVISVDKFKLHYMDEIAGHTDFQECKTESLAIPVQGAPRLIFPETTENIMFKNENISFHPDLKKVQKKLAYIQAMGTSSFRAVSKSMNKVDIPSGTNQFAANYYSLRQQFPIIYGIGSYGLANGLPAKRYAQAEQLKAYLLPFDQVMNNFVTQLTNIYKLYDAKDEDVISYYHKRLSDMPELIDLINTDDDEPNDIHQPLNRWSKKFEELRNNYDLDAVERLNDIASNLLARFGEEFPVYTLRKINENSYGKYKTDTDFELKLLSWKRRFISEYDTLSYNRAKAYDYKQVVHVVDNMKVSDPDNNLIPGIIHKAAILLGIEDFSIRSLSKAVRDSGIRIYNKDEGMEMMSDRLDITFDEDVGVISIDDVVIIDEKVENLYDDFYYVGNSKYIFEDVLRNGANLENYEIRRTDRKQDNRFYVLLNKDNQTKSVVHVTHTKDDAVNAIYYAASFINELCTKSEGVYLIEHILLAPPYHSKSFGFDFSFVLDTDTEIEFEQHEYKTNGDRNKTFFFLRNNLAQENQIQLQPSLVNGKVLIQILTEAGKHLATSKQSYPNHEAADDLIEKMKARIKAVDDVTELISNDNYYAYYGENQRIEESFFSFQMSFILPSWPVRFQSNNFRSKFDNLIYEQAPIHIAFDSYWIDLKEMTDFEDIYYKWIKLVTNNLAEEQQKTYAYKLITKIIDYQNQPNQYRA